MLSDRKISCQPIFYSNFLYKFRIKLFYKNIDLASPFKKSRAHAEKSFAKS